jgi:hypothetical protein
MEMDFPSATPKDFSGAEAFVRQYGYAVWCELCDTQPIDEDINVTQAAKTLDSLQKYHKPELKLRAVLRAIETRCAEADETCPFVRTGRTLKTIRL